MKNTSVKTGAPVCYKKKIASFWFQDRHFQWLKLFKLFWTVVSNILAVASIVSLSNQFILWIDFFKGFIEYYQVIRDAFILFFSEWLELIAFNWFNLQIKLDPAGWFKDYMTLGLVIINGPLFRLSVKKLSMKISDNLFKIKGIISGIFQSFYDCTTENNISKKQLVGYMLEFTPILLVSIVMIVFSMIPFITLLVLLLLIIAIIWPIILLFLIYKFIFPKNEQDEINRKELAPLLIVVPSICIIILLVNYTVKRFMGL